MQINYFIVYRIEQILVLDMNNKAKGLTESDPFLFTNDHTFLLDSDDI